MCKSVLSTGSQKLLLSLTQVNFLKELSKQEDLSDVMPKLRFIAKEVLSCESLRYVCTVL